MMEGRGWVLHLAGVLDVLLPLLYSRTEFFGEGVLSEHGRPPRSGTKGCLPCMGVHARERVGVVGVIGLQVWLVKLKWD